MNAADMPIGCGLPLGSLPEMAQRGMDAMNGPTMKGKVYFVGVFAGEGEPLSGEAVRVVRAAEVVLHDADVPQAVLDLTPPWTQVRNVGQSTAGPGLSQQKIHGLLIGAAREGHAVVRLRAGERPVAETAGDELEALEQAGVAFEIIDGTPSAVGAAAGSR
jgi:siroheme synthase